MKSRDASYNAVIPANEILTAIQDLSSNAFKLLTYYYTRNNGWEFKDSETAKSLGVNTRTLASLRNELINKDYLLIVKGKIDNYFVGRKQVMDFKAPAPAVTTKPATPKIP